MHDATYDSTFFKVWGTSNWTILILLLGRLINYMSPWKLAMYGYYGIMHGATYGYYGTYFSFFCFSYFADD